MIFLFKKLNYLKIRSEEIKNNETKIIYSTILIEIILDLFLFYKLGNLNYSCVELFTINYVPKFLNRPRFIKTCDESKTKGLARFSKKFEREENDAKINKIL